MKPATHPLTLLQDALLRPARFAAFLDRGWRNIGWAALATVAALSVTLGCVVLVLGQIVPLGARAVTASLLLAPLMALMFSGLWVMLGSDTRISPQANAAFWILRSQLAVTPLLALFL